jgi:hypothetical protein
LNASRAAEAEPADFQKPYVPCSRSSRAASTVAPSATRLKPLPTEIRRTPTPANAAAGGSGLDDPQHVRGHVGRFVGEAVLEVDVQRYVGRVGEVGRVLEDLFQGHAPVELSERRRVSPLVEAIAS